MGVKINRDRSNPRLRLAIAHERELHHPHRDLAAADVDAHVAVRAQGNLAGRDTGEGDRLAQGRRKGARQDLAVAVRGDHPLAVTQHALLVHHQADHLPRRTGRVLRLEHIANGEGAVRSEEHTYELQSLMRISYAVFCLKNKTKNKQKTKTNNTI